MVQELTSTTKVSIEASQLRQFVNEDALHGGLASWYRAPHDGHARRAPTIGL